MLRCGSNNRLCHNRRSSTNFTSCKCIRCYHKVNAIDQTAILDLVYTPYDLRCKYFCSNIQFTTRINAWKIQRYINVRDPNRSCIRSLLIGLMHLFGFYKCSSTPSLANAGSANRIPSHRLDVCTAQQGWWWREFLVDVLDHLRCS